VARKLVEAGLVLQAARSSLQGGMIPYGYRRLSGGGSHLAVVRRPEVGWSIKSPGGRQREKTSGKNEVLAALSGL